MLWFTAFAVTAAIVFCLGIAAVIIRPRHADSDKGLMGGLHK